VRPMMNVSRLRRSECDAELALDHRAIDDAKCAVGPLLLPVALLVLDQDRTHTHRLVELDHPRDALHVAVAVVAIGEERQRRCRRDVADAGGHVGHADQADVGQPEARREHRRAADRERAKPGARDQARRQRVMRERRDQRLIGLHGALDRWTLHRASVSVNRFKPS